MRIKPGPVCCIIPPHMLEAIAQHGSLIQRDLAIKTLAASLEIHDQRPSLASISKAAARLVPSEAAAGMVCNIYDAEHTNTLPGRLVRRQGDAPSTDPAVNEAFDGADATYNLYAQIYNRNSIDGNGARIDSSVHYMQGYDNAFWNGRQMVYGDGDEDLEPEEQIFRRFTIAIDVIGHELTHGITQNEAALVYSGQSGALNESFSDVFGSLVKQHLRNQTAAEADWLIGQGLFTANVTAQGVRSLKAPGTAYDDPLLGKDPQPAHMRDYNNTTEDNGGVHINSGIPNHAFYVAALEMGGYAWEKAGRIWYVALCDKLNPESNFAECADQTFTVAGKLFGEGSLEQQAVRKGWAEVGINVQAAPEPPGCMETMRLLLQRPTTR